MKKNPQALAKWHPFCPASFLGPQKRRAIFGQVRSSFFLILLLFLWKNQVFGQSEKLRFEFMVDDDAIPSNPYWMVEDYQGNLWGILDRKLSKFDGIQWTKIEHNPKDPCCIPALEEVQLGRIFADYHKNLWIGSSSGLIRLDLTTNCFSTFFSTWGPFWAIDICEDSNGNLWLLESKKGLIKIKIKDLLDNSGNPDSVTHQVFPYQFLDKPGPGLMPSIQMLPNTKGGLWLASYYGLGYFDFGKEKFSIYQPAPDTLFNPLNLIHCIFKDPRGILWLGTRAGLIRFDPETKMFEIFSPFEETVNDHPLKNRVAAIHQIDDGRLILGAGDSYNQRLKLFDPIKKQFISIDGNSIIDQNNGQGNYTQMLKDRSGGLWIINDVSSLAKFNYDDNQFVFYDISHRPNSIKGNHAQSVYMDRHGNLYIGTDTHLNVLDKATGKMSYFATPAVDKNSRLSGEVDAIIEDQSGMIWLGTENGLNKFDPATKAIKPYAIPDKNAKWAIVLYEDRSGILWVGTQSPGKVFQFDRKKEKFILISEDPQLWKAGVRSFEETRSGDLWVSSNGGLVFFDRKKNELTKAPLEIPEQYINGLHDILLDKNGKIWTCAITGPLFKYDPQSKKTYSYEHIPAFQDNMVRSIAMDRHGMLWIASAKGMIHFDPNSEKLIRLYHSRTWLQPGQQWWAPMMESTITLSGEIIVQGHSGVLVFHPDNVRINTVPPNVVITGLRFQKRDPMRKGRTILPRVISETEAIRLPYRANDFSIDYVGIHLKNSKANQYAYRLAPLEKDWLQVGTLRQAKYTNLAPGKYTFQVKASNSDGVWNEEGASLQITILAPWWATWWAYLLYVLSVGGAIYAFIRWRTLQQRKKIAQQEKELTQERLLNERLQQIDQLKDQFLANTTHELRTPLHGIVGIAESLFEEADEKSPGELRKNLHMIMASGRRLTSLVNDLLDFSKAKNQDLQLKPESLDLHVLAEVVLRSCQPLIGDSPVELRNDIPADLSPVLADSNRLQQILYNLVGNAIKFTRKGHVSVGAVSKDGMFEIVVEDTGIGIPPDKQEAIFRSFEQADGNTAREFGGTGLGLSITRQLVELHGGKIRVESAPGIGSRFFFTLPISSQPTQLVPSPAPAKRPSIDSSRPIPLTELNLSNLIPVPGTGKIRLLVVDDEPINHQVLRNYLGEQRYEITSVMDGTKALEVLDQGQKFDLVLLDVMMPRMSGYEVCQKIRDKHLPSELPVIMVTAKNQVQDLVEGLGVGANDYLSKPFSKDEFLARVKTQLDLHRIFNVTGKFVPNEFIRALGRERITDVQLGDAVERNVSILFSDIRDFTSLSEEMTPTESFRFINAYNGRMGPFIRAHHGFVNQFLGDGVVAIFPESPVDAVKAAVHMHEAIREYNVLRMKKNRKPIRIGIGVHAGPLIMGIIGDETRMDAATIADTVNTASRIENLTKHYGAGILLSEEVLSYFIQDQDFRFRYLGRVQVKGKQEAIGIYECLNGESPEQYALKMESKEQFDAAMEHYFDKEFGEAAALFQKIVQANPMDHPARLFINNAGHFLAKGVPDGWNGIETIEVK